MPVSPRLLRRSLVLALVGAAGAAACVAPARAQQVGVNSAVNPDATGTPPGAASRKLILGQEVVHNEHVVTGPAGQTQILFLDESAMTVGPNSDLSIDNFVYDPNTGKGQLAMNATAGVMRFVGGKLSKNADSVTLKTPSATIGIRGGVFLANLSRGGKLDVVFLYGKGLTVTGGNITQTITRPGFGVSVAGPGQPPSSPHAAPPNEVAATLASFNGKSGSSGGSSNPPSDASVANSGISNDISGNVAASVQQAAQSAGTGAPPAVNVGTIQTNTQQNTTSVQGDSAVSDAQQNPTPPGTPIGSPQPQGTAVSGTVKIVSAGSNLGFTDQSSSGRIPYAGTLNDGVVTGSNASGQVFTLSPLVAGQTTGVTGTATGASVAASGTAFLASDGDFFYGNLTAGGSSGDRIFVFGGVPVSSSFFAPASSAGIYAFELQPDAALANGSQAQTIPFLASIGGGTLTNPVVSPLYLITQPNQAFGSFNANTNPTGKSPFFLQASLAINGAGSAQRAALAVTTGAFFTSSDNGLVVGDAIIRGMFDAGNASGFSSSGGATVPDANGNTLFGGTTIDGFVLDSNKYNTTNNFVTSNANFNQGGVSTPYAFNQVALATATPAGLGANRSTLNEQGFFGGIMGTSTGAYILTGATDVTSNPSSSQVQFNFSGGDPFTSSRSGVNGTTSSTPGFTMVFGAASGRNFSRSAFIDNNTYAAVESENQPFTFNGTSLATSASGATTIPAGAAVSSGVVPGAADGLFQAAGASMCNCQYLQWGYWDANIPQVNADGTITRSDRSFINTWLSGMPTPTVNMPTSGTGSYTGGAIGTISTGSSVYLAAGGFTNTYDFGAQNGTIAITNLDGKNYSGLVRPTAASNIYGGQLNGTGGASNITGSIGGYFYGPSANETGGNFYVHSISGANYLASGIFAGSR